jgi:signal transduction histidine kinase
MNLRSPTLENGDLGTALAETARHMLADKPVDVRLKVSGTARPLAAKTQNELLRIGQEAITNSFKHSQAGKIHIAVDYHEAALRLRIQDDGQGFRPEKAPHSEEPHFGLLGMRERAKQIGASLSIHSQPGRGTEVTVDVPLNGKDGAEE